MTYEQTGSINILSKMSRGLIALMWRQILYYGVLFFGNILLTRMLVPEIYGVFIATFAFQGILMMFTDIGLGQALIQREQPPTQSELGSLFSLQLIIYTLIATVLWAGAPWIVDLTKMDPVAIPIIRALSIVLPIAIFRSIPAMLLERELRFEVIALAEVLSVIGYQIVLVILVWIGYGLTSIIVALAVRYILDLAVILYHRPWCPRFSFKVSPILPYLRFSIGMQGVRLMAYIKDQVPLLALLPVIGTVGSGIWGWSLNYIGIPVYFNRLVDRLVFPLYSRVQHDPGTMGAVAGIAIWLNFSVGLPAVFVLVRFADLLVPLMYGPVWLIALPTAYALAPNMIGGFITGSLFPALFAKGQTYLAFRLFFAWVVLTVLGAGAGLAVGQLTGMALAYSLATLLTCVALLRVTSRLVLFPFWKTVAGPVIATTVAVIVAEALDAVKVDWMLTLSFAIVLYMVTLLIVDRKMVWKLITSLHHPTVSAKTAP